MRAWFTQRFQRLRTSVWLRDAGERAIWQALQGALAALTVAVTLDDVPWALLASYALGGALASLTASFVTLPDPKSRTWWQTMFYRLVRTAAAALAGLLVAVTTTQGSVDFFAIDWTAAAKVLGATVLIAFAKNVIVITQPERGPPSAV